MKKPPEKCILLILGFQKAICILHVQHILIKKRGGVIYLFIYLKSRVVDIRKGREKKNKIFYLIYSPNGLFSWSWARLKPGAQELHVDCPHGWQRPKHLDHPLLISQVH